jgi:glycosyltransferase involved in cell wall biosynthesis
VSRYARRAGVPFICHIASENDCRRTTSILRSLRRPQTLIEGQLTEEGIKEANVIVAQTADQIRLLGGEFGRKADRLIRNFHPIPPLLPKPTNRLTVVWIANFKPLKRPELFFEIAAFLQDLPEVEFLMIGEPYSSQRLQSYIERAVQRCSNVKYMGAMLQKDVNELLDRSHLLVNTSEWEGFSNTFIQAWMRSIPVLTLGVNPDRLFEYTYLGRCHDSTREVANSIRELASNSGILEDMGMKSRKFAVEQFSMRNAADLARLIVDTAMNKCEDYTAEQEV